MLKPLHDFVLVKEIKEKAVAEDTTFVPPGPVFVPPGPANSVKRAQVIDVGPGRLCNSDYIEPEDLEIGDIVFVEGSKGCAVWSDGEKYLLVRYFHIFAVDK